MEHLNIEASVINANAWNGIQVGIPALSAFMGFMHGLERKIIKKVPCEFSGLAIGVKEFEMREFSSHGNHFLNLPLTGDIPVEDSKINRHIMNQAYIDLVLSFVIGVNNHSDFDIKDLQKIIQHYMNFMRIAGGTIVDYNVMFLPDDYIPPAFYIKDCTMDMLSYPGDDILHKMINALEDSDKHYCVIANGFRAISPIGHVKGQRDSAYPHVFAEQTYTLIQYVSAKHIDNINDFMFHYHYDDDSYLCTQNFNPVREAL